MLGRTIGNYQITERLGEGGMGIVYLAEHPALGRKAAIKVLHPQMAADPQVVSRFFHEARASNAIRHPNIVDTYDYGTLPDGTTYIIMELLEGESLAARLKREARLTVDAALSFTCQAAAGLYAAHGKGIVHRDLKPDNLFLIPDPRAPGHEQVKILDFGIAKLAGNIDAIASHKTRTGTLMGTPLYMSPEQCLGVREVDYRTDIYSLGCILYEMVCGGPPFTSEGFGALINMHINQPPEPPSQLNRDVPPAVDHAIMKMLAKSPADRFANMSDVLDTLFPLVSAAPRISQPGVTPPGGPLPRPSAAALSATTLSASALAQSGSSAVVTAAVWRRRRRALSTLAAAGGVALAAVLFFSLRPRHPTTPERAAPIMPTAASAAALPSAPPAPVAPPRLLEPPRAETVDVSLDSVPAGAQVAADGAVIGTTPFSWKTAANGRPTTLTFSLDGYRRESIQAIPAAGLRLAPTLRRTSTHHARNGKPHPPGGGPAPPDDIRSER